MKSDLISRQAAINIAPGLLIPMEEYHQYNQGVNNYCLELSQLPSAQPEAIPIAWLEEKAKWFSSLDNPFSKIEATNIRVLIKDWLEEQEKDG